MPDLRKAIIDFTDYGVPQNRKRIIIVGLRKEYFGKERCVEIAEKFYSVYLPKYRAERKQTVKEAIGLSPGCALSIPGTFSKTNSFGLYFSTTLR